MIKNFILLWNKFNKIWKQWAYKYLYLICLKFEITLRFKIN